jgi:hyaluronoglucosaminidase
MRWVAGVVAVVLLAGAADARAELRWRGVVEGAYGPTWDAGMRERTLRWMPAHGFDAYVHAPKDDLYQRTLWRDPYPADQQAAFDREIRLARELGVRWIPNLSPALPLIPTPKVPVAVPSKPLCFSCPADLDAVVRKLAPFAIAGARTFMVSFDDVVPTVSDPRDLLRYGIGPGGFGRANGDFLTRLLVALRTRWAGSALLTVGYDYDGPEDSAYLQGLRATLDRDVDVMWTGSGVAAEDWTPADARSFGAAIGRRPVLWDNWANNDTAGSVLPTGAARIFLGPYHRRADAAAELDGIFLNPMNAADLNLLPHATAGRWMADPAGYDAATAFADAVAELAGPDPAVREALRAFAETEWSNKLDRTTEAPTFVARNRAALTAYDAGGDWFAPFLALGRELALVRDAPTTLQRMAVTEFAREAAPWLGAASRAAGGALSGTALLAAERPALTLRVGGGRAAPPSLVTAATRRLAFTLTEASFEVGFPFAYGWRGGTAFELPPYAVPRNVMDDFHDEVLHRDAAWLLVSVRAASSVRVEVDGAPVDLNADGSFSAPCGAHVIAVDGAGGRTAGTVPC